TGVHKAVRNAHGSAAVGHAVVEFVNGLRFMQAGEAQMIVRAVNGDVLVLVFVKRGHEGFKVIFAANGAHVLGGKVGVHTGTVPIHVLAKRFAMEVHIHA